MKNKNIEKEVMKELNQKFGENSILKIDKNTFLILTKGEGFKFIKGKFKGSTDSNHQRLLNLALHHGLCAEIWVYSTENGRTIKEINVLYKGFEE